MKALEIKSLLNFDVISGEVEKSDDGFKFSIVVTLVGFNNDFNLNFVFIFDFCFELDEEADAEAEEDEDEADDAIEDEEEELTLTFEFELFIQFGIDLITVGT